ncbi:dihydroorotase family protein [Candidatus Peribacteria bacterium]|jgi:dihydroorotase|nr:dihydroorotase family protein [Candidatus Peribacteria bacterium]MBT4241168.1 dihydroorotase family protein [Candidatus Peribacteria bacterium]MBT4473921.1 dihydroorotase family protein [Candidatus Peribacteria bacterium]
MSTLIKNGQIVTENEILKSDILIEDGKLIDIYDSNQDASQLTELSSSDCQGQSSRGSSAHSRKAEVIDATGLLIFPGLIDCHVHFREPGMEEVEDMTSGSQSALHGGVTTVCDMPNNSPAINTIRALDEKIERKKHALLDRVRPQADEWRDASRFDSLRGASLEESFSKVDIRFFFGASKPEHIEELKKVDTEKICGVKLYMGNSTGNQKAEEGIEEQVFKVCSERNITLVCHCEDEQTIQKNKSENTNSEIAAHSEIRSVEAAVKSTKYAIELGKKYGTKLHIAHVSTSDELELIKLAKDSGQTVTCEVAPHHLFLNTDDYETLGTLAKMNPPIRTKDHCEKLWEGVVDGTVDCISSDHAPHTLESKNTKDPLSAPSGVPGTETILPLLLSCIEGGGATEPAKRLGKGMPKLKPEDIVRLMHTNPNKIFGLGKGCLAPGNPVNLCLVNPNEEYSMGVANLHSKCGWTPYEGWNVQGKVVKVIVG